MVSQECAFPFLEMFNSTHDRAIPKLSQKVMLVVDHRKMLRNEMIMKILGNEIVKTGKTAYVLRYIDNLYYYPLKAIPQTIIVQPNKIEGNDTELWINIWSAFPFSKSKNVSNRFFLSNESLELEKPFVSLITDLDGIEIRQGVFDYPPFTKTTRVVSVWP